MSLYEWLLFLHVLAAFLLVAGVVVYGVLLLRPAGQPAARALGPPALALWNVGGLGVLVFGVWLALEVDGYELWDGWIVAALILWFVASAAGGRLGAGVREGQPIRSLDRSGVMLAIMALATAALLLDMIFKPGA